MLFKSFQELLSSAQTSRVNLVVTAVPDGRLSVLLLATTDAKGDGQEALNRPIAVTATAEELDAEFATLLKGHATERRSLAEQLAAEATILQGATRASADRAAKKLTEGKGQRTKASAPQPDEGDAGDDALPPGEGNALPPTSPEVASPEKATDGGVQQGSSLFAF